MKLRGKIWLLTFAIITLIVAADAILGYRNIESGIRTQLERDAKDIRAMLMATRRIYQKQFLTSNLPINEQTIGLLPAHALSRISRDFPNWSKSGMTFNNVSDRPRNPDNQADADELEDMAWFRANPKAEDRLNEVRNTSGGSFYHYVAPVWIEPYCLKCHGEREDAPPSIAKNYDAAYGYKVGELRGLVSIRMPTDTLREAAYREWLGHFSVRLVGYASLLLLLGMFLNHVVTARLARLKTVTDQLAAGDYATRSDMAGNDEITELSSAFNQMAEAIQERDNALKDYHATSESMREGAEIRFKVAQALQESLPFDERMDNALGVFASMSGMRPECGAHLILREEDGEAHHFHHGVSLWQRPAPDPSSQVQVIRQCTLTEPPHGHYFVPLMHESNYFGVLVLDTEPAHPDHMMSINALQR